jgi:hypothetical protein
MKLQCTDTARCQANVEARRDATVLCDAARCVRACDGQHPRVGPGDPASQSCMLKLLASCSACWPGLC